MVRLSAEEFGWLVLSAVPAVHLSARRWQRTRESAAPVEECWPDRQPDERAEAIL